MEIRGARRCDSTAADNRRWCVGSGETGPGGVRVEPLEAQLLEMGFCLFDDSGKSGFVPHGQIGEDLPVDGDIRSGQAANKLTVGQSVDSGCCIDAGNPQFAELPLFGATVSVGVLLSSIDGLPGGAKQTGPGTKIPLGQFEDFFSASPRSYAVCCPSHEITPSPERA